MKELKELLLAKKPEFWNALAEKTRVVSEFSDLFTLSNLRKRAIKSGMVTPAPVTELRLALIGAYSFYPLRELVEHCLALQGFSVQLFVGEFDNYNSEILDDSSELYAFNPEVVLFMPSEKRCKYSGSLLDPIEKQRGEVEAVARSIRELGERLHAKTHAEILLCNFIPPDDFDPGAYRARTLASDWSFRRAVNTELGLNCPEFITICDLEFLASRRGIERSRDARAWFETKQPGQADFLVDVAREVTHLTASLRQSPKKVLVLDLDNTVWGGVIGDLGVEGIEIGDTSPRGEAFKAFQKYAQSLSQRGVLLAVCSKNDHDVAMAPFEKHPEMVLRPTDIACFKANWEPKSENLKAIAQELNLGLDSLVFVDDNPAEVEIVRQFAPSVTAILLGPDPANYVRELSDARLFEPRAITEEDARRAELYRAEGERKKLADTTTDMASYLSSLEMESTIREFSEVDLPRVSQLINKSNQFNLTTRRRTEAEVGEVMRDPAYRAFSVRLADRFGDHGLIAVLIGRIEAKKFIIDTWLMSCRVLKRQVEEECLNELVRLARLSHAETLVGHYIPSPKNKMVANHYPTLGFKEVGRSGDSVEYHLNAATYVEKNTHIKMVRRAFEAEEILKRSHV